MTERERQLRMALFTQTRAFSGPNSPKKIAEIQKEKRRAQLSDDDISTIYAELDGTLGDETPYCLIKSRRGFKYCSCPECSDHTCAE
jgi:hypothetical protein